MRRQPAVCLVPHSPLGRNISALDNSILHPSFLAHRVLITMYSPSEHQMVGRTLNPLAFLMMISESILLLQKWVPSRQALTTPVPLYHVLCVPQPPAGMRRGQRCILPHEGNCLSLWSRSLLGIPKHNSEGTPATPDLFIFPPWY